MRPTRTSLYPEVVRFAVWLRWLLIAAAAGWLVLGAPEMAAVRVLEASAVYAAIVTALYRLDRHPPLLVTGVLDVVAIVSVVLLQASPGSYALLAVVFPIVGLTLGHGWLGAVAGLTVYLLGEGAAVWLEPTGLSGWAVPGGRAALAVLIAVVLAVVVERHEAVRGRLMRVAIHDPVTGLHNRAHFAEALENLHKLAVRGNWAYSVLVVDIDGLRRINREEGWSAGDRLLRRMGGAARAALRSTDLVARIGEDEFAIALPETATPAAVDVARKLRDRMQVEGRGVRVAVGVADIEPSRRNGFEQCLHAAYVAVGRAKGEGTDGVAVEGVSSDQSKEGR